MKYIRKQRGHMNTTRAAAMLTMFAAVGSRASLIQAAPLCHTARAAYCKPASKRQDCGALPLISTFRREV
jgi:hypothetical protein